MNPLKPALDATEEYLKQSKWTDMALIKFCLWATGVMVGLFIPKERRTPALIGATIVYIATCIPIMIKFIPILIRHCKALCKCTGD